MDKAKLAALQQAGAVAHSVHERIAQIIAPGVNLLELEAIATSMIAEAGMIPAFKGFNNYPAVTCISVNDEIVHGIPKSRVIEDGDVVSVDLGVSSEGWIVDTARTHIAGGGSVEAQKLIATARQALDAIVPLCVEGNHVGDIGATIEKIVTEAGFFVVEDLTGHGVGKTLQEPPTIPNHGRAGTGPVIKNGMVLAIEPIITTISTKIGLAADGWTIIALDGGLAAHDEDTIAVTPNGPIILTR